MTTRSSLGGGPEVLQLVYQPVAGTIRGRRIHTVEGHELLDGVAARVIDAGTSAEVVLESACYQSTVSQRAERAATTGELVVRVDDVDAHCERARVAGAEIEYGPEDQPYGVREYGARDLEGRRWAFVMPLG